MAGLAARAGVPHVEGVCVSSRGAGRSGQGCDWECR